MTMIERGGFAHVCLVQILWNIIFCLPWLVTRPWSKSNHCYACCYYE